jgi:adenylosuccinate lyase
MIARYTRPEMAVIWSEQRKLETWLEVELAVCETLADRGLIPLGDLDEIRVRADFDLDAVKEREKETDHDVAAFVDVVASSVGEAGRWVHYGLTSSDVLDTGLALQLREAGEVVLAGATELKAALIERAR